MDGQKIDVLNLESMKNLKTFLLLALLMQGCESRLAFNRDDPHRTDRALDEMRLELADVKHTLTSQEMELHLLEEKVKTHKSASKQTESASQVSLERRIAHLEKLQEKIALDLRALNTQAHQTGSSLAEYKRKVQELEEELTQKLGEISKLREMLGSISQAVRAAPSSFSGERIKKYRVKAGDSLEKIARREQVSLEALKKYNDLASDHIMIGQELKIPSE